jgi:ornithine cyclodeaminase
MNANAAPSILYLTEADVRQTLSVAEAVDLAERGALADGQGDVAGDKFYMNVGDAGFIKPFSGYMAGEEMAYVKTFSYFPENPERFGLPTTSSMVLLFDARNGFPVCIMEAGWVTGLKTGASTTITARWLARQDASRVAIFGAGMQGRMHLQALAQRFDIKQAWVLDLYPQAAADFVADLQPRLDFPVQAVDLTGREEVVRQADIIVTVTTGDQALVEYEWLKPGAFVAKLGSYQEVDLDVLTRADKVLVDRWKYVKPRISELKQLAAAGEFGQEDVYAEWPDVVAGLKPGRETPDEIIVYIALGIWGEYAAILPEVYRRAREMGLGVQLS